jgi:hypothetical protein
METSFEGTPGLDAYWREVAIHTWAVINDIRDGLGDAELNASDASLLRCLAFAHASDVLPATAEARRALGNELRRHCRFADDVAEQDLPALYFAAGAAHTLAVVESAKG